VSENKLSFIARDQYGWEVYPKPIPASQLVPDWWRSMVPYSNYGGNSDSKNIIVENQVSNATFKKCTPMLDALTSGYIVPLFSDVQVRVENGSPRITWRVGAQVFQEHGEESKLVESPPGYTDMVVKYNNTWIPRTPAGYSVLITAPFGYRNLPFHCIPAVVDSDKSALEIVPPMWVRKNFEGIVEKGTPMFQILPFKRESWKSEYSYYKDGEYGKIQDKNFGSTLVNNYIKNHWSKKTYK
jgi:hypothetical protein